LAHTGTLFLDEVSEMPLDVQVKLLRILEAHTFRRLGGSKDIQVDGAFVADALAPSWLDVVGRNQGLAVTVIAGPVLGAAQGAVARFRERLASRTTVMMQRQKDQGVARQRLAESAVEVDAARLLIERNAAEIDAWTAAGQPADPPTLRWIRDTGFAAQLCTRATGRVFEASGGGALQDSEPIQRFWRDVNAGHAHAFLNWDTAAEAWATGELGPAGG
jgi:alkylation response protein AidB-like acyl-CoA dehydrogenase